jgi:hypothetical protein
MGVASQEGTTWRIPAVSTVGVATEYQIVSSQEMTRQNLTLTVLH